MKYQWKQRVSVVLSAAMVLSAGNVTTLYAAEKDTVKKIARFDELEEEIAVQILEIGAEESEINFPASLWAEWVLEEDETVEDGNIEDATATESNADKKIESDSESENAGYKRGKIGEIYWVFSKEESIEQEFDSDTEGTYVYEPVIPSGYVVDDETAIPQIIVEIEAAESGMETGEEEVPILVETGTGLNDGILTIAKEKGSGTGWSWNGAKLDINGQFSGNKQIAFAEGINPAIQVNSGLSIGASEEPSIIASDDLTIKHGRSADTVLIVDGLIKAKNITISCNIKTTGDKLFDLADGETLKLEGGSLNGGSIYLSEGSEVEGMGGLLSDQGRGFDTDGKVTVVGETESAADDQLTAGSYVYADGKFIKDGVGGGEGEEAITGLKDGILTLTQEKGGVSVEGWAWNGWRLDINDKFIDNKQIVFVDGLNPTIKVNRAVTLTPDPGQSGIMAAGDLTITAANVKFTVNGSVEADSVTITDGVIVDTQGIKTKEDISISGDTSVIAKADRPEAALHTEYGTITVSGTATVIASNQSGTAMNHAPDTSGYADVRVVASKNASGKPTETYVADEIAKYQYLKVEKMLSKEKIESSVENLTEDSAPELVDGLAEQIRSLSSEDKKNLTWATIGKMDDLLQKATNIEPISRIGGLTGVENNKRIQDANISGALLTAGISLADAGNTQVVLNVTQRAPEKNAVVTFDCDLKVNEEKVELEVPVEVTIKLPPEFYPVAGMKIHHVGDGIDEWMDFAYNGADNTTTFRTDSFSTFSIVKTLTSPGSGNGSSGGSGSSGGGGGSSYKAGSFSPKNSSNGWIHDTVGWWYQNPDKSYPKDGWARIEYNGKEEWYFFDKNGYMMNGWVFWNGRWYYMSTSSDGTNGIMLTGWQTIDGKRYYFSEAIDGSVGVMLANIRIGEYYLGQDGTAR